MKFVVSVIALLIAISAQVSAFRPGLPIIRECPKCRISIEEPTMESGNTFGARFWTDGKCEAPMLPNYPWLVKCPECKHLFWIDEAKKVGTSDGQTLLLSADYLEPSEADYYRVAATVKDKVKQKYLRIRAWRAANDQWRNQTKVTKAAFSPEAKSNLNALSLLLKESNPEERLLKAEIARELGKFEQCRKLLNYKFNKHLSDTASFIKSLADQKCSIVREITTDEKEKRNPGG